MGMVVVLLLLSLMVLADAHIVADAAQEKCDTHFSVAMGARELAQSFRPSRDGKLAAIDLWVAGKGGGEEVHVMVDVMTGLDEDAVHIGASDLSIFSVVHANGDDAEDPPSAHRAHIRPKGMTEEEKAVALDLEKGKTYYIVVKAGVGMVKWCMADDHYTDGRAFVSTDQGGSWIAKEDDDRTFRVYLDVPRDEL